MKKPADEKNRRLVAKIDEYQKVYGIDSERLAATIGCSESTFYRRKASPDTMTIGELRKIVKRLDIPFSEILPHVL